MRFFIICAPFSVLPATGPKLALNLKEKKTMAKNFDNTQLLSFIERAEKLNEDAAQIAEDLKEVFNEAKSAGYDPKYIRKMIQLRKLDQDELYEADELEKLYRNAVGL